MSLLLGFAALVTLDNAHVYQWDYRGGEFTETWNDGERVTTRPLPACGALPSVSAAPYCPRWRGLVPRRANLLTATPTRCQKVTALARGTTSRVTLVAQESRRGLATLMRRSCRVLLAR